MFRKKRPPAPYFKVPPPYHPSGQPAGLRTPVVPARLSVMRVKEIHPDWLICEGWDPDLRGYYKEIYVARPWWLRESDHVRKIRFPYGSSTATATITSPEDYTRIIQFSGSSGPSGLYALWPRYYEGELLIAAKMETNVGVVAVEQNVDSQGRVVTPDEETPPQYYAMEQLKDDQDRPIVWTDLNVGGKQWVAHTAVYPFAMTTPWTYPNERTAPPHAKCKRLKPNKDSGAYEEDDDAEAVDVYFPLAYRDSSGKYLKLPRGREGSYIQAQYVSRFERWEVVGPPQQKNWQASLTESVGYALRCTPTTVTVHDRCVPDEELVVEAYWDYQLELYGYEFPEGHLVTIEWREDDARFVIIGADCPKKVSR